MVMAALVTAFCAYRLALCAFIYQDAWSRGADAMSWLGLASVLGVIGFAAWLVARPRPALEFQTPCRLHRAPGLYPEAADLPQSACPPPMVAPPPPVWAYSVHRMLATFFAAMAVTVFVELPVAFLIMSQGPSGSTGPEALLSRLMTPGFLLLSVAMQDAVLVGFTYFAMFRPGHLTLKSIGARPEANIPRGPAVGALAGLALFAVATGLGWLVERTGFFGPDGTLFRVGTPSALVLTLIATVAIAPPAEELFFRGYALPVLERKWGPAAGICLSALMFAAVHGSIVQLVPIFFAGVVLAVMFREWGIVPCIAAHAVNNSLAVVLLYLGFG